MKALSGGEYDDFVVEATLKGTAQNITNNYGIMLRATDVTDKGADLYNGYYVGIGKLANNFCVVIGYGNGKWNSVKSVPFDYKPYTDYKLKVMMYGNTLAVWLDGKLMYQNEFSLFDKGRVGVRTFKQLFECSSFSVRTPTKDELIETGVRAYRDAEAELTQWSCDNYDAQKAGTYIFNSKISGTDRVVSST